MQAYQDVSLKLVLQEILWKEARARSNDVVFLQREVVLEPLRLRAPPLDKFHLYCSPHNVGAMEFVGLLKRYYNSVCDKKPNGTTSRRKSIVCNLEVTHDANQMTKAVHFLCYLNRDTNTSAATTAFHAELDFALKAGMHIILVHEMRPKLAEPSSKTLSSRPQRHSNGMLLITKRLYKELAVMICGRGDEG